MDLFQRHPFLSGIAAEGGAATLVVGGRVPCVCYLQKFAEL